MIAIFFNGQKMGMLSLVDKGAIDAFRALCYRLASPMVRRVSSLTETFLRLNPDYADHYYRAPQISYAKTCLLDCSCDTLRRSVLPRSTMWPYIAQTLFICLFIGHPAYLQRAQIRTWSDLYRSRSKPERCWHRHHHMTWDWSLARRNVCVYNL